MMSEEETQPLITASEQRKHDFRPVYYYFVITFVGCLGTALISQATTDAEYYVICKYAGIDEDVCLRDPRTSDYESILASYVDVIGGIFQTVSLFFISHFVNLLGMRPVIICACIFSMLHALGFWLLLEVPYVHYLWAIVPEIFAHLTFNAMSQVLSSIYISEQIHDATFRTLFLGWMEAVSGGPRIVAPGLGGYILRWVGLSNLFLVSMAFSVAGTIGAFFFLQESHKVVPDTADDEEKPSIFDSAKLATLSFIEDPIRRITGRKVVFFLVATSFLSNVSTQLESIYVKKRFGWSAVENGYLRSTEEAIKAVLLIIISPLIVAALSRRFTRRDHDYDTVDAIMARFVVAYLLVVNILKGMFPYPKTYFVFSCLSQGEILSQSTLMSLIFKYAPEGKNTSFWIGIVYIIEMVLIPSGLICLNIYRMVLRSLPDSLFWAFAAVCAGLVIFTSSIRLQS